MVDTYSRHARITPVLIVALPVLLLALLAPIQLQAGQRAAMTGVLAALLPLFDQLGRSRGRRREPALFAAWGGAPTTQLLRWRGPTGPVVQERRHRVVQRLTGFRLPTADEEADDPAAADEVYAAAVRTLRVLTADCAAVLGENRNYGFRRNLVALRPWGLVTTGVSLASLVVWAMSTGGDGEHLSSQVALAVADLGLLTMWVAVARDRWVREAAWIYAERLFEQVEHLQSPASPSRDPRDPSARPSRLLRSSQGPRPS